MKNWPPGSAPPDGPGRRALRLAGLLGATALLASAGITQWLAARFAYHPALGWNLAGVYPPWEWLVWRARSPGWPGTAETFALLDQLLLAGLCLAPIALAWAGQRRRTRPRRHEGVHGTARFATRADMVAAGLLPARAGDPHRGLYLGVAEDGSYLRHEGPEPVLVCAPTRSGKTQGPMLMGCLSAAEESLIAYDIRGDVYEKSAGWRAAQGNRVIKWDMMAEGAARWNPLAEVRLGTATEFADVAAILEIVADPGGEGLDNPRDHFPPVAADFLVSLTLFCLHEARARGRAASFGDVRAAMSDPDRPPQALYEAMVANRCGPGGTRHAGIAQGGADQLARADRERASVLSTCTRMLRLFRDPRVAENTARSDFRLAELLDGDRPAALYVIPREQHSQRLRPLLRLFMAMLARRVLEGDFTGATSQPHRYRCRLLWDEFTEARRMDAFLADMARLSGAGLRVVLFVQGYDQILREYGRDEPVTNHCHILLAYTPNKQETAEWIERWLGRTTVVTEDVSRSGNLGGGDGGYSMHYGTISRPLLTADEIGTLDKPRKDQEGRIVAPGRALIKVGGHRPVLATQALYFFDPVFAARAALPVPPAQRGAP